MATLKADKAQDGVQPRFVHAGSTSVKFVYSVTASLSSGDVIQLCKVPHGAIVDGFILVRTGAGQFTAGMGDGGSASRYLVSATLVANTVITDASIVAAAVGYQYNLSDDAADQFDTIDLTVQTVTTATAAGVITGVINYHCDEGDPA